MIEWRPCPRFPEYAVSEFGEVKRVVLGLRGRPIRPLTVQITNQGYELVNLAPSRERKRSVTIHRLVCEAWHGPPPPGTEVDHIDRDRRNNHYSNLRWATRSENQRNRAPFTRARQRALDLDLPRQRSEAA